MNIYIANDFNGEPLGVVLATSQEKAEIAWTAQRLPYNSVEEIDPNNTDSINGIIFLLSSQEKQMPSSVIGGYKFRKWKRGI